MRSGRGDGILTVFALAGLVLAGCQPAGGTPTATTVASPTEVVAAPPTEPASPATVVGPTAPPTARPLRTALEASDPTTVSLANGRPTLVEFFAFW